MNDKEAFEKWWLVNSTSSTMIWESLHGKELYLETWQDAIGYKQKELGELEAKNVEQKEIIDFCEQKLGKTLKSLIELEKLQAENAKLRDCVEWYADRKNCDNADFSHVEIDDSGEEIADGGYRARQCLKEIGAR